MNRKQKEVLMERVEFIMADLEQVLKLLDEDEEDAEAIEDQLLRA